MITYVISERKIYMNAIWEKYIHNEFVDNMAYKPYNN